LGTAIAPTIGGILILSAAPLASTQLAQLAPQALQAYRLQQAASIRIPYAVIGGALVLLAIMVGTSKLPQIEAATTKTTEKATIQFGSIRIFCLARSELLPTSAWKFQLEVS
jgi:MFS transporter, FHS family, L-fucose permease